MAGSEGKAEDALAYSEYWDSRYSKSDGNQPTHEWFKSYDDLEPFFSRHLFQHRNPLQNPKILHLGAGDSTVPRHLLEKGYRNQLCVDFSPVVVELMKSQKVDGVEWICGDVRDMPTIADNTVDVAFDKGTLDAMIYGSVWDPPDEVKQNANRYMREVCRVLKDDGVFLYVTFRQPHFVKPLLHQDGLWDQTMEELKENESSFSYYAFVLKKARRA